MSDSTQALAGTAQEMGNSEMLRQQIEGITSFNAEIVGGGSVKKIMNDLDAKSADLWQVPPEEIVVLPNYNPRVHNAAYYEGVAALAQKMADNGYMKDKPLAVYIGKYEGRDRMILQDGHRRHAAVLFAKAQFNSPIKTVPVVVKDKSNSPVDLLKAMLQANEASPFSTYEKAIIAKRFKGFGWTDRQIADEMGCTTAAVGQLLAMAGAPEAIQQLVNTGQLSATAMMQIVKEHGEDAIPVAQAAVRSAKAQGKTHATMKDVTPAEARIANRTKNAKKVAHDMYKVLVALSKDETVQKKADAKLLEKMDDLIAKVEFVKPVKEPKAPKPPKAAKAPKPPKAPKAAKATPIKTTGAPAKKTAGKASAGSAEVWNNAVQQQKAASGKGASPQARSSSYGRPMARNGHARPMAYHGRRSA